MLPHYLFLHKRQEEIVYYPTISDDWAIQLLRLYVDLEEMPTVNYGTVKIMRCPLSSSGRKVRIGVIRDPDNVRFLPIDHHTYPGDIVRHGTIVTIDLFQFFDGFNLEVHRMGFSREVNYLIVGEL